MAYALAILVWLLMVAFIFITDHIRGNDNPHSNFTVWSLSTISLFIGCITGTYIQKRIKDKKETKESLEHKIEILGNP